MSCILDFFLSCFNSRLIEEKCQPGFWGKIHRLILATKLHKGAQRKKYTEKNSNNEKLLRGVQGGGFLEKSPLAAGGTEISLFC
jgi:hypothetical protein